MLQVPHTAHNLWKASMQLSEITKEALLLSYSCKYLARCIVHENLGPPVQEERLQNLRDRCQVPFDRENSHHMVRHDAPSSRALMPVHPRA